MLQMGITQNAVIWDWHNPKKEKVDLYCAKMVGRGAGGQKEGGREEGREGGKKEKTSYRLRENI